MFFLGGASAVAARRRTRRRPQYAFAAAPISLALNTARQRAYFARRPAGATRFNTARLLFFKLSVSGSNEKKKPRLHAAYALICVETGQICGRFCKIRYYYIVIIRAFARIRCAICRRCSANGASATASICHKLLHRREALREHREIFDRSDLCRLSKCQSNKRL